MNAFLRLTIFTPTLLSMVFGCTIFEKQVEVKSTETLTEPPLIKFSDIKKLPNYEQRQFHRMTRERLEQENDLLASSGSLWNMEGQSGYLFVQNNTRKEGDIVPINLEGEILEHAKRKVKVIKSLLEEIERENQRYLKLQEGVVSPILSENQSQEGNSANLSSTSSQTERQPSNEENLEIRGIISRVVEKTPDGLLRVKGYRQILINDKEFRVLISGLLRPQDFSDEGVSSNRLIDAEVDVLSVRRKKERSNESW